MSLLLPSPEQATANKTCSIVTRPKGSWKWQNRHGLSHYAATYTRDGRLIWRFVYCSNDKLKPRDVRRLVEAGANYGGLHNRPVG